MGVDTPRKSFLHLLDAETWWYRNWTTGPSGFDEASDTTSLDSFEKMWTEQAAKRNQFIAQQDSLTAQRVITAAVHDLLIDLPAIESQLQLCCHGTHHRAQILNMLRQAGAELPKLDYVVWLRL
jgi:uncharacterized damage-inducible protein DinB